MANEVMSSELVQELARYRSSVARWKSQSRIDNRLVAVVLPAVFFAFLFSLISMSLSEGDTNVAFWFRAFSVVTFIGGIGATIAACVCIVIKIVNSEPPDRPMDKSKATFLDEENSNGQDAR